MRFLSLMALCLALTACYPCAEYNREGENMVYQVRAPEDDYRPETGRIFKVAGFEIEQGQQMRDFLMTLKSRCTPNMWATMLSTGHIMWIMTALKAKGGRLNIVSLINMRRRVCVS